MLTHPVSHGESLTSGKRTKRRNGRFFFNQLERGYALPVECARQSRQSRKWKGWWSGVTSILIADGHEVVRLGLRAILEAPPNCEVVAEALDGKEAVLKAIATKPDIAVVADTLPLVDGLEATRQIRASLPKTEVLVFAMHDNAMLIEELLKAGARGYVRKSDAKRCLLEAIEALAAHRAYFSSAICQMLHEDNPAKRALPPSTLTERQRAVVKLVAEGYSTKQIARFFNLSSKTVDAHLRNIRDKLNLSKSAELVRYAVRNKIVEL